MGGLSKLVKPLGIGLGAAALGSLLFPQTASMMTGGVLGSDSGTGLLSGMGTSTALPATMQSSSVFSNPTVLSAGILAGTSLLSGLFGSNSQDEASQAALEENQRQFDATMAYKQAEMAQALELAKMQLAAGGRSGGDGGAGIAAATALKQARANAIQNAAQQKISALQIPLAARANQMQAAQTTGAQSGDFFASIIPSLQRPALRG